MSALIYLQPRDNPEYFFRQLIHDINTNFSAGTSGGGFPIQNGLNTYTGGTSSAQTVNVSALTINTIYVSGSSLFNIISATTYYSGSTPFQTIINQILTGSTGGGFSGWTSSTGSNSIVANNGLNSNASGAYSIAGGTNNLASGDRSFIGNGLRNSATTTNSVIVGGSYNITEGQSASILGGKFNSATTTYSTVVGGLNNIASSYYSVVAGGVGNVSSSPGAFIGGGKFNSATTTYSTVVGGINNIASSYYSVVVGGTNNISSGNRSFIGGGNQNLATGNYSSIVGGWSNSVSTTHSFIGGGYQNTVISNYGSILGGKRNIVSGAYSSVLAGANITASTSFTAYVPKLNIQTLGTGTSINNLGIDANGFVVSGTTASEFTGGTVSGMTTFSEGISATTYYGLPVPPAVNLFNYYNFS